jgi:putative intracellular protease/amidase
MKDWGQPETVSLEQRSRRKIKTMTPTNTPGLSRRTILKTLAAIPFATVFISLPASAAARRILLVASNPVQHPVAGFPLGVWGEEIAHSWLAFEAAGFHVDLASPRGGEVAIDGYSDPRNPNGGAQNDTKTLAFLNRADLAARLLDSVPVKDVSAKAYDAILVLGGLGPVITFRENPDLQNLFLAFYKAGKISAALCHGSALLLDLRRADGTPLIAGRKVTGFTTAEEDVIDKNIGIPNFNPYRIDVEARKLGADFRSGPPYQPFVVTDGNLVTGQQQQSTDLTARTIIEMLGKAG